MTHDTNVRSAKFSSGFIKLPKKLKMYLISKWIYLENEIN